MEEFILNATDARPNKPLKLSGRTKLIPEASASFGRLRFAPPPGRGRLPANRRDAPQLSAISVRRTLKAPRCGSLAACLLPGIVLACGPCRRFVLAS